MKILRSQLIIIALAIVSVVLIFILPRSIIKDNRQLNEETHTDDGAALPDTEHSHSAQLSEKDQSRLNELRNTYLSVSDKEKKLKFADSLSNLFRSVHQYDSAAKYREEIVVLNPGLESWENAGDAYFEAFSFSGKSSFNQKAQEYYQKALRNNPAQTEVKAKLAMTYIGGEETMTGVKLLREILEEDPENESAIYHLGILSLQSGQYDKAIKRFKDLVRINPTHAAAYFYLGVSYKESGKKKNARESFEKALSLDNDPVFRTTVEGYLKELN